jgi:hypothetical protein
MNMVLTRTIGHYRKYKAAIYGVHKWPCQEANCHIVNLQKSNGGTYVGLVI